jgi:hypothetical protein
MTICADGLAVGASLLRLLGVECTEYLIVLSERFFPMRSLRILAIGGLALVIGPAALTQVGGQQGGGPPQGMQKGGGPPPDMQKGGGPPGGMQRPGGGGGGWGGQMNMDPNERWNQMTGGKDVWVRSQITDQRQQFFFDMIARSQNITNGQITRQQFLDFSQNMRQRWQQGGGRGMNRGGGPPGANPQGPQGRANGQQAGGGGGGGGWDINAWAEVQFKRLDKNGDGVLNYDEMPDNLRAERDKWDTNKDGLIDLNEYKEFVKARADQIRAENPGIFNNGGGGNGNDPAPILPTTPAPTEVDEPKKNIVYRVGKLPKDLPPWFTKYDKDGDGQIGLYEWKLSGEPLDKFFEIDRNGDGFLTVEEVLRYEEDQKKKNGGNRATASSSPGNNGDSRGGGPPNGGGGPPNGGGRRRPR